MSFRPQRERSLQEQGARMQVPQTPDLYYKELSNRSIVLPSETRAICAFLNPALLRVMNHSMLRPYMCTMAEPIPDDFAGVTKSNPLPPSLPSLKVVAVLLMICWDRASSEHATRLDCRTRIP